MKLTVIATAIALAVPTVWANDGLEQMRSHAGRLEQEYREMGTVARAKVFDPAQLQDRLNAVNADVDKLKSLVAEVEASDSAIAAHKDWQKAKSLVQLIGLFHDQKAEMLADGDISKKRKYIRSHADGLAARAKMLSQTSERLLRSAGAGS